MSDWIEPIFDRTSADVTRAKLQVKEWIEALGRGEQVSVSDLKGYFNTIDLNRIENNTDYLRLASSLSLAIKTDWNRTDLPNQDDIDRIISNINALIKDFDFENLMLEMPTTILTYKHANTIEHNLSLIKYLLEDMSVRIQAEFNQIDISCDVKLVVALTLPFGVDMEKVNVRLNSKAVKSNGLPLEFLLDEMTIIFTAPVVNSDSLPVSIDTKIEFGLANETNNSDSNPIKSDMSFVAGLESEVNNSKSNPIGQGFDDVRLTLDTLYNLITPNSVKMLSNITINMVSEVITNLLISEAIKTTMFANADIISATFDFADMFIKSIFDVASLNLNSVITQLFTKNIRGMTKTIFSTDIKVALCAYSRLADYKTFTLKDMGKTSLKDLSYREIG